MLKKKHFHKPWLSSQLQKLGDKREQIIKKMWKANHEQHLNQWKKATAELKSVAKKNKKEDWEKLTSSLTGT